MWARVSAGRWGRPGPPSMPACLCTHMRGGAADGGGTPCARGGRLAPTRTTHRGQTESGPEGGRQARGAPREGGVRGRVSEAS